MLPLTSTPAVAPADRVLHVLSLLAQSPRALNAQALVHIHIAEQQAEVQACLAWSGQRPMEWLLNHMPVDARWCMVHATHMTAEEYRGAAASQAVAGLCPLTKANLRDGLFDLPCWENAGGRWGIGSDSHIAVNAGEELMMLEYGQRLHRQQRNVAASIDQPHVATHLMLQAVRGGAQAAGRAIAGMAVGQQADLVSLRPDHVALAGLPAPELLDAHVFASSRTSAIDSVWVAGEAKVVNGQHPLHNPSQHAFVRARTDLISESP